MKKPSIQPFQRIRQTNLFRISRLVALGYLTPMGRAFGVLTIIAGGIAGGRPSSVPNIIPIVYCVATFTIVFFGVSCVLAYLLKPKLGITRHSIHPTTAGQEATVEITIENKSAKPVYDLEIMEFNLPHTVSLAPLEAFPKIPKLNPGEHHMVHLQVRCFKRGSYTLNQLCVGTAYPFGMCRGLRRSRQETTFLVYPSYTTPETFLVPEGRRYQPGGFLVSSKVGESPEFMGTRDYRSGDNVRHIHWASWARVGKPVVKQYHEEYFVRMAIVVDSEVKPDATDEAFESGISIAAGIADYLSHRDYIIDIFAAGATVYHFQSGRALAYFENILQILACLESSPTVDWSTLWNQLLVEASKLTAIVAVFMDWNREREELIEKLKNLGVGVRVIVVKAGPALDIPPGLSHHEFVHVLPDEKSTQF